MPAHRWSIEYVRREYGVAVVTATDEESAIDVFESGRLDEDDPGGEQAKILEIRPCPDEPSGEIDVGDDVPGGGAT